jgi:hypothetical protein
VAAYPGRVVFGGPLSPVGWTVGLLEAAFADVVDTHRRPDGEVRWLSAGIFDDGRWEVEALGEPQPFEEAERPLDRELLLRYLTDLGIEADEPDAYGEGVLVRTRGPWRPRTSTIAEAQGEYGIGS